MLKSKTLQKQANYDRRFVWLAFGAAAVVMMFVFYAFDMFPFGETTILRMDLYHQYGPLFAELYERIAGGDSFLYSWTTGGGGSFLGNFYNYLSSPVALIIMLLGHENIPEAIAFMVLIKASLASASFCYYLKRSSGICNAMTSGFGVMYAFCGYFIAYYWNVMWLDAMYLLPLLVLGIEEIINRRKYRLYTVILLLAFVSNYYMSLMLCMFSVIYFLVYYFGNYSFTSMYRQPLIFYDKKFDDATSTTATGYTKFSGRAWEHIKNSRLIKGGLTFAGASLLAACLAAFSLVPVYFILQSCSATSGTFPTEFKEYFSIFDFLANHLASVEPTIRSSGDDVLPNVFCGIATVILVPLYLFLKSEKTSRKLANIVLLAVLFYSFNTNFANYVWHGFHFPNDLPYRFSFIYSFILLTLAYKTITHIHELSGKAILGSGIGVTMFIILTEKITSKNVDELSVFISIAFVVIYTFYMQVLRNEKKAKASALTLFLCIAMVESMAASTNHYSMNQVKSNYTDDYDSFVMLKEELDKRDGTDFYRMELADLRTRMDPAWYYYNGVSTFSSMAYELTSNVQSRLGLSSNYINSYTYFPQTPIYNAMMSLKYVVDNDSSETMSDEMYTMMFGVKADNFIAYENNYYLPIGYCVDSDIKEWSIASENPFSVQNDYFELATGVSDAMVPLTIENTDEIELSANYTGDGSVSYSRLTEGALSQLIFTLTPATTQSVYLFIDSTTVDEISLYSASKDVTRSSEIGERVIDIGVCEALEPITVTLTVNNDTNGHVDFYAYGMDMTAFRSGFRILEAGQLNVETFDKRYIKGTAKATKDCVFYTSIPYDESWAIKVDGEVVGIDDYVAIGTGLLGFNLKAGEHTIELEYMPKGFTWGCYISAAACLFCLLMFMAGYVKVNKKKRFVQPAASPIEDDESFLERPDDEAIVLGDEEEIGIHDISDYTPPTVQRVENEITADDISNAEPVSPTPSDIPINPGITVEEDTIVFDDDNNYKG